MIMETGPVPQTIPACLETFPDSGTLGVGVLQAAVCQKQENRADEYECSYSMRASYQRNFF